MKQKTLAIALGLVLGGAAFGSLQAQEQGIRPVPEDLARQPVDERTEDTMPYPEDSVQGAATATTTTVQDALAADDDAQPLDDESDPETASTDVSEADEAAAADNLADTSELPADAAAQALETRFQAGDANGDGSLSEAEIAALDGKLGFAGIDVDGNGSVSREEWRAQPRPQVASDDDGDDE